MRLPAGPDRIARGLRSKPSPRLSDTDPVPRQRRPSRDARTIVITLTTRISPKDVLVGWLNFVSVATLRHAKEVAVTKLVEGL